MGLPQAIRAKGRDEGADGTKEGPPKGPLCRV